MSNLPFQCEYTYAAQEIEQALVWQKQVREILREEQGKWPWMGKMFLTEHMPVYSYSLSKIRTIGESGLVRNGGLSSLPAPQIPISRGGSITFHGPGQLVCYLVFSLKKLGINVAEFNQLIEMSIIKVLSRYSVEGRQRPDHLPKDASGVWVQGNDGISRKIASRGLHVDGSGITNFGCALNVSTDLSFFEPIFPCGLDIPMTSMEQETGKELDVWDVGIFFPFAFEECFGLMRESKKHLLV